MRTCSACPKEIGPRNRSGKCRSCVMRALRQDPEIEARRSAAFRHALATNPEMRAKHLAGSQARLARWRRTAEGQAFTAANAVKASAASNTPEGIAKRAESIRLALTGWCPAERRREYLKLRRLYGSAEARRIIEEDMAAKERKRRAALSPFERQDEYIARGGKLVERVDMRRADPSYTIGGVASGFDA